MDEQIDKLADILNKESGRQMSTWAAPRAMVASIDRSPHS